MKLSDLSCKSRNTLERLAREHDMKPVELLNYINSISLRKAVSKHSLLFSQKVSKHS